MDKCKQTQKPTDRKERVYKVILGLGQRVDRRCPRPKDKDQDGRNTGLGRPLDRALGQLLLDDVKPALVVGKVERKSHAKERCHVVKASPKLPLVTNAALGSLNRGGWEKGEGRVKDGVDVPDEKHDNCSGHDLDPWAPLAEIVLASKPHHEVGHEEVERVQRADVVEDVLRSAARILHEFRVDSVLLSHAPFASRVKGAEQKGDPIRNPVCLQSA